METVGCFGWSSKRVFDAYKQAIKQGLNEIEFQAMSANGKDLVTVTGRIESNSRNTVFTLTWPDGHNTNWYD